MKNDKRKLPVKRFENTASYAVLVLGIIAALAAVSLIIYAVTLSMRTDISDFTIDEDGVLTAYEGSDRTVTIPEGVKVIAEMVFHQHTEIEKVVFPSTLTTIKSGAFFGCSSLKTIKFSSALSFIGNLAFSECMALTEFTLPASVEYIHSEALQSCPALTEIGVEDGNSSYISKDGVLFSIDGKTLITYPTGMDTPMYRLPSETNYIAVGAFSYNERLQNVTLNEGLLEIGERAFFSCNGITALSLPATVTTIYKNAFSNCLGLKSITFDQGIQRLDESAFASCVLLEEVVLPSSIEELGQLSFAYCTALRSITIPERIHTIGAGAFESCENLTVYGYEGSPAQAYAEGNDIPFSPIA